MARTFTKNANNKISLGINAVAPLLHGASAISFHCFVNFSSINAATNSDRPIAVYSLNGKTAVMIATGATPSKLRIGGRSINTESFEATDGSTTLSTGVTYSCGGVLDFAGDAIRVYLDGIEEADTAVTFNSSTFVNSTPTITHDSLGGDFQQGISAQIDGVCSEFAYWKGDIGTAGFESLQAYSAELIRPDLLVMYVSMIGNNSPETDRVSGLTGTISGSVPKAVHPRIIMPYSRGSLFIPVAAVGGRGTLQVCIS
jgi:hypothetical protein